MMGLPDDLLWVWTNAIGLLRCLSRWDLRLLLERIRLGHPGVLMDIVRLGTDMPGHRHRCLLPPELLSRIP